MLYEPAAARNCVPILDVLKTIFKPDFQYKLLEIGSGSGQHAIHFAQNLPNFTVQPSELNPRYLHSIVAFVDQFSLPNVRIPLHIDVAKRPDLWALPEDFKPAQLDAILAINFVHYSSESAIDGLFQAARGLLKPGAGKLIIYGPFAFNGVIKPQSNVDFDAWLRAQDPEFGLRDLNELEKKAKRNQLRLEQAVPMPANNHTLIFTR